MCSNQARRAPHQSKSEVYKGPIRKVSDRQSNSRPATVAMESRWAKTRTFTKAGGKYYESHG